MTPTKKSTTKGNLNVFSDFELSAMRERAAELRAEAKAAKSKVAGERQVMAAIEKMPEPDKSFAKKIHAIVRKTAPKLIPKTWYGFPAYANKDGKVVCFFQYASKFKYRYSTLGFQEDAKLDDGAMWPVAFAVKKITPAEEKKIVAMVKRAAG